MATKETVLTPDQLVKYSELLSDETIKSIIGQLYENYLGEPTGISEELFESDDDISSELKKLLDTKIITLDNSGNYHLNYEFFKDIQEGLANTLQTEDSSNTTPKTPKIVRRTTIENIEEKKESHEDARQLLLIADILIQYSTLFAALLKGEDEVDNLQRKLGSARIQDGIKSLQTINIIDEKKKIYDKFNKRGIKKELSIFKRIFTQPKRKEVFKTLLTGSKSINDMLEKMQNLQEEIQDAYLLLEEYGYKIVQPLPQYHIPTEKEIKNALKILKEKGFINEYDAERDGKKVKIYEINTEKVKEVLSIFKKDPKIENKNS